MRIFNVIELKTFCGTVFNATKDDIVEPQVRIIYSCTSPIECENELKMFASQYMDKRNKKSLTDYAEKNGARYFFKNVDNKYNISFYIEENNVNLNNSYGEELKTFIDDIVKGIEVPIRVKGDVIKYDDKSRRYSLHIEEDILAKIGVEEPLETGTIDPLMITDIIFDDPAYNYENHDDWKHGELWVKTKRGYFYLNGLPASVICAIADYIFNYTDEIEQ